MAILSFASSDSSKAQDAFSPRDIPAALPCIQIETDEMQDVAHVPSATSVSDHSVIMAVEANFVSR